MSAKIPPPQIIRPRIVLVEGRFIGPGKIDLLRAVASEGSISGAARAQGMSYKRAWSLLNETSQACGAAVISSKAGGEGGGGAELTELGRELITRYDEIERICLAAVDPHLKSFHRLLKRHAP